MTIRTVGRAAVRHARRFARDESGATAIEYALIAALIFLAIVTAVGQAGIEVADVLQVVADAMS